MTIFVSSLPARVTIRKHGDPKALNRKGRCPGRETALDSTAMSTRSRRQQMPFAILFIVLVLLMFTQRRLAELDFDSTGVVRIENNEKPDGDEIFNRLVFVDDTAAPQAPGVGEACHAGLATLDACSLALVAVLLSEPRAPPYSVPSCA